MSENRSSNVESQMYVPEALRFYASKLSFSKNRVRLQSLSSQTANSNGQIIVRLPSNTMLNLASLTMTGSVRATITGAATPDAVALPTNLDYSFIESISLISNGGIISQPFLNYKLIANVLNDVYGGDEKISNRIGLQGSLPSQLVDYAAAVTAGGAASLYVPFAINSWVSATQSMQPSYINTNLLGDLELRLTLTDNSILQSGSVVDGSAIAGLQARCNWDMKDINFYIETASVQNTILEQAIDSKLKAGEPLIIPFENVFSFQQNNSGGSFNQRFSVSSQSINKIIAVTQLTTDVVNDGSRKGWFNGVPQALRRNSNAATQCQFSVNNQYSPNYLINSELNSGFDFSIAPGGTVNAPVFTAANVRDYRASNGLVETLAALDTPDYDYDTSHHKLTSTTQMPFEFLGGGVIVNAAGPPATSAAVAGQSQPVAPILKSLNTYWVPYIYQSGINTYLNDKYVVATSFDLACDQSRLLSGINTLGSNSQMFYNVIGGVGAASTSTVFVLCTSTIQVRAGAQLSIIQ